MLKEAMQFFQNPDNVKVVGSFAYKFVGTGNNGKSFCACKDCACKAHDPICGGDVPKPPPDTCVNCKSQFENSIMLYDNSYSVTKGPSKDTLINQIEVTEQMSKTWMGINKEVKGRVRKNKDFQ